MLASGSGDTEIAAVTLSHTGDVRIEIESERDGLVSLRKQAFVIDYDADGETEDVISVDVIEEIIDGNDPP